MLLHVASTPAGAAVTVSVIFLLIFAMSFAFGPVPEGGRRFSREWALGWLKASFPRLIVAGGFAGLVLVAALSYGNNSTQAAINCDKPVPPLTGKTVDDPRLLLAIDSLGQMVDAAENGDAERARTLWLTSDAHNLMHDVDRPLRKGAPDLTRRLCERTVALENVMVGQVVPEQVAISARLVAEALQEARPILRSVASPTTAVLAGPCEEPIGSISSEPLTRQRLLNAIEQFRQVSSLAGSGDQAGAEAAFAGDAHNITHDIDGPLRTADKQLAVDLCLVVTDIETNLGVDYDAVIIADRAAKSADLLEQSGKSLGILQ